MSLVGFDFADDLQLLVGFVLIRYYLRFIAVPAKLAAHFIIVDGQFGYSCLSLLFLPGWQLLLIDLHS